jgi:hypothetical protein
MTTEYNDLLSAMHRIVTAAAEIAHYYNWGSEFAVTHVKEAVLNFRELSRNGVVFVNADVIASLTDDQKYNLMMHQWNGNDSWLIPLWMSAYIHPDAKVMTISGTVKEFKDMDDENRAGLMGCWLIQ